jgi:hypothetical protein
LETSDYSFGDRLLHHLVLGVPFISKVSFELDGLFPNKDHPVEKHVFVSGLARAGTTILMRTFFNTGQFRSLTYRDMPFVLMPGVWKKLSKSFHKQEEAKERAHGDGIYVDFDSPEAFEEVFWRTFSGDDYIFDNCLQPHSVSEELIEQFRLYVRRIIASSSKRYLSKNNNNILRIGAIRKAFPESLIIIPFREPLQQAISLLNQHQKFCDRHSNDKFSYNYMRWLGHHEFGMTHKPFQFEKETLSDYEADNINYWLNIWINTYSYLLNNAPSDSIFVCFEDLCESPVETLRGLFESAELLLDEDRLNNTFNAPPTKEADGIDENLRNQAQGIYQDLRALAKPPS